MNTKKAKEIVLTACPKAEIFKDEDGDIGYVVVVRLTPYEHTESQAWKAAAKEIKKLTKIKKS